MEEQGNQGLLERLVEKGIEILGTLGLNTTRMRWRWNTYRTRMAERRREAENRLRGVTGRHRMCPSCRALVPTGSRTCSECGESLAGTTGPGVGRLVSWLLPGIPQVTAMLVTANFAIFLLMAAKAGFVTESRSGLLGSLFSIMSFSGEAHTLFGSGNNFQALIGGASRFLALEWWRLFCPIFMHGGLMHLLFNTYIFVQIGPLLEEEYGGSKFFVLYVWAGVAGFFASEILRYWLFGGYVNTVGASGSVFGLVGAALVYGIRRGGVFGQSLKAMMTRWTIYFVLMGFVMPGVDNYAHIGGLVGGAAFAGLFSPGKDRGPTLTLWRISAAMGVILVLVSFIMAGLRGPESVELWRSIGGR